MAVVPINTLKSYFETGDKPTQSQFEDLIDSCFNEALVGYQYIGVATPQTSPSTPTQKVFYLAPAGTYNNFGSTALTIPVGSIGVIKYDSAWSLSTLSIVTDIIPSEASSSNKLADKAWVLSNIPGVFVAVFDETSHSDTKDAYEDGRALFAIYNDSIYALSAYDDNEFWFVFTNNHKTYKISLSYLEGESLWQRWSEEKLEDTNNKVTTISSSSTNTQYPSAKAVYDAIILKAKDPWVTLESTGKIMEGGNDVPEPTNWDDNHRFNINPTDVVSLLSSPILQNGVVIDKNRTNIWAEVKSAIDDTWAGKTYTILGIWYNDAPINFDSDIFAYAVISDDDDPENYYRIIKLKYV